MIGCWVVVKFSSSRYPGEVVTIEEEEIKMKCMKRVGFENQFVWPEIEVSAGLKRTVFFV